MRRVLVGLAGGLTAALLGAVGTDFGAAIVAEYRLSRTLRAEAGLDSDPRVSVLGFPFVTQARAHHYDEVEIRALGVPHPEAGAVALEATLHGVDLTDSSWLIDPGARLPVDRAEGRVIVDSTHLGRAIGVVDLLVEAPPAETDAAVVATTESGISEGRGVVFTGTPQAAGIDERVSVSVDLTLAGPQRTTLVMTPTAVLTGPGTAGVAVPDDRLPAVLAQFGGELAGLALPFGLAPTSQGVRGSDLVVEGIADDVVADLGGFDPAAAAGPDGAVEPVIGGVGAHG